MYALYGSRKVSTVNFILHWQDQIRKYDYFNKINDQISDFVKHTIQKNAVNGIFDFRIVNTRAT